MISPVRCSDSEYVANISTLLKNIDMVIFENIDIDKAILENIDKVILKNIDRKSLRNSDIDKGIIKI